MNLFRHFGDEVQRSLERLAAAGRLPVRMDARRVAVDPPRETGHGDVTTNAAMVLAKDARMKPRDLATLIAEELGRVEQVISTEIAGPGFINLRLADDFWRARLIEISGSMLKHPRISCKKKTFARARPHRATHAPRCEKLRFSKISVF